MVYLSNNKAITASIAVVILVVSSYFLGSFMSSSKIPIETGDKSYLKISDDEDVSFTDILEKELSTDNMKKHLE